jgi:hypothetical protein
MGNVVDMALAGGALYVLTDRGDRRSIEIYLPGATEPTRVPDQLAGSYDGLRYPTAIASASYQTVRYLFIADQRGPEAPSRRRDCGAPNDCFLELETGAADLPHLASRSFTRGLEEDFIAEVRLRVDALPTGGKLELMLGTAEGRPGLWIALSDDGYLRPVRSDGAFPIDSLAISTGEWHAVRLVYSWAQSRYDIAVDDSVFSTRVPVYYPMNRPVRAASFRLRGVPSCDIDAFRVAATDTVLDLDFEDDADLDEGWDLGPYFRNDPPPAVFRYPAREHGGPNAIVTDPRWVRIDGIALERDLTLCVSVEEQDPADPTGVLRRAEIQRIERTGSKLPALAETGTGLGFVTSPGQLAFDGTNLLVVEPALARVQKLSLTEPNTALFQIPPIGSKEALLRVPQDVVVDDHTFIYVADTGNDRVLRFRPTGAFADTVYSLTFHPTLEAGAILEPRAVVADSNEVWVADRAGARIVVLKRSATVSGGGS